MTKWISVKDRLPEAFEPVLVFTTQFPIHVHSGYWIKRKDLPDGRMWNIKGSSGGINTRCEVRPPTHWTPLPEPPKECLK